MTDNPEQINWKRRLPLRYRCDVAVIGGGIAGVCAACAAAVEGAEVVLVERFAVTGGNATVGGVANWSGETAGQGAIFDEIIADQEAWDSIAPYPGPYGTGSENRVFDHEILAVVLQELLLRHGVRLLLHTRFVDIQREGGRMGPALLAGASGLEALAADVFIDTYRSAIMAFCNWCVETDRLAANPLAGLCKADVRSDRRRVRRALTEDELRRLLKAARLRPVAEYGRETVSLPPERCEGRSTWRYKGLTFGTLDAAYERGQESLAGSPEFLAKRERLELERMLIYKTMVLTGLRLGELASITVGQLHLDAPQPHAELLARDAKAGTAALIPLRADLVEDLRGWLDEKLEALREQAEDGGAPLPLKLPVDEPLFSVPRNLIKSFNLDLAAADIPKDDERGRTVDLHALRHTVGSHLSKNGVAPRTAQAALRHSSLGLTMNVYTDPTLLDVAGAIQTLPSLSSVDTGQTEDPSTTA